MTYALFRDGVQISKAHAHRDTCKIEAMERGLMLHFSADLPGEKDHVALEDSVEIREVKETP